MTTDARSYRVAIVGAGKIGLPLAAQCCKRGATVTVCDINANVVDLINAGKAPFYEPGLDDLLASAHQSGKLTATTDTSKGVSGCSVVVIVVPALLTKQRNFDNGNLISASRDVAVGLQKNSLVCYETTMPVGATRNTFTPIFEEFGFKPGKDMFVAFSPERVKSLKFFDYIDLTPKVTGGIDDESSRKAAHFYRACVSNSVIDLKASEAAEFVKLAGMAYRDVNIGLANELAFYAEKAGLNGWDILAAANTDNETNLLHPGIGVGGHCTPVYPYFLLAGGEKLGAQQELSQMARKVNEGQPARQIERLGQSLGCLKDKTIALLGLAFRPGVKEPAFSASYELRNRLLEQGARVKLHDPMFSRKELADHGFEMIGTGLEDGVDAAILVTGHECYQDIDAADWEAKGVKAVLDGRNFWDRKVFEKTNIDFMVVGKG